MRKLSARQVVILAIAITIIGVVMAWDGVAGALVLAVAIIALLTDWKPFARRPALRATLVRDGQRLDRVAVGGRERAIGAIDPVAIVAEQMVAAERTRTPPMRTFSTIGVFALEPHEEAIDRFERELSSYREDLTEWLERYEALRWPEASFVEVFLCLHNAGTAPADNVRLRLRLPKTLRVVDGPPELDPPPESPAFKQRSRMDSTLAELASVRTALSLPTPSKDSRGGVKGPTIIEDGGVTVADFAIASLTHGFPEFSASPLCCVPSSPGEHVVAWEAHAGNLAKPASGTFTIVAREQPRKEPVTTLAQLLAEDVSLIRDDEDE